MIEQDERGCFTGRIALIVAIPALALTLYSLGPALLDLARPVEDGFDAGRLVLLYADLPRLAVSLLAGAALGVAGAILQQVLRNPLASPTTLGFSAGAKLALAVASLFAPGLIGFGRDLVAFAGSLAAALVVFALGARRRFSPIVLVLGGLVVSLWCGALSSALVLLNERYLASLFIWGGGSLQQQDWAIPLGLAWRLLPLAAATLLMARPLGVLSLPDDSVRSLGLPATAVRAAGAGLALCLAAVVTSAVGVIGFIGLVAPTIARLSGAREFTRRLVWSPVLGAGLLWFSDQAVQLFSTPAGAFLPTGAATALFGSPLLFFLLPRLRIVDRPPLPAPGGSWRKRGPGWRAMVVLAGALALVAIAAAIVGREPDGGWAVAGSDLLQATLPWRVPRVLSALAAGVMLAVAGTVLQRLTGNEMASPEVLGISAGAMIGVAAALFGVGGSEPTVQAVCAGVGSGLVLVMILAVGRRSGFAPERVLLAGIALNALLDAAVGVLSAAGDPRAMHLLRWMGGSTYGLQFDHASIALASAAALAAAGLLCTRWLDLLPMGGSAAGSLGVPVARARLALFGLAAGLTAAGTMVIGPLSFVGLMAPHLARELGLTRALPQLLGASLAGGALMVAADWFGRTIAFPYEIAAGLVSALIGAPFLMLLLMRARR